MEFRRVLFRSAFVYAELAARRPEVGGQYAYLRDAYGPTPAFLYGWSLLLVIQSGGMAAVAITFARYFLELTELPLAPAAVAVTALLLLTGINCLGVRTGATVQRSEEQTSELQSLMRSSYADFCLKQKIKQTQIQ